MGAEVPASDAFHVSIVDQMNRHLVEPGWKAPAGADGPLTVAEPTERPDDRAQWDEAQGCWIEWDPTSQSWLRLDADPPDEDAG